MDNGLLVVVFLSLVVGVVSLIVVFWLVSKLPAHSHDERTRTAHNVSEGAAFTSLPPAKVTERLQASVEATQTVTADGTSVTVPVGTVPGEWIKLASLDLKDTGTVDLRVANLILSCDLTGTYTYTSVSETSGTLTHTLSAYGGSVTKDSFVGGARGAVVFYVEVAFGAHKAHVQTMPLVGNVTGTEASGTLSDFKGGASDFWLFNIETSSAGLLDIYARIASNQDFTGPTVRPFALSLNPGGHMSVVHSGFDI